MKWGLELCPRLPCRRPQQRGGSSMSLAHATWLMSAWRNRFTGLNKHFLLLEVVNKFNSKNFLAPNVCICSWQVNMVSVVCWVLRDAQRSGLVCKNVAEPLSSRVPKKGAERFVFWIGKPPNMATISGSTCCTTRICYEKCPCCEKLSPTPLHRWTYCCPVPPVIGDFFTQSTWAPCLVILSGVMFVMYGIIPLFYSQHFLLGARLQTCRN